MFFRFDWNEHCLYALGVSTIYLNHEITGMSFAGMERVFSGMIDEEKSSTARTLASSELEQRDLLRQMESSPCFKSPSLRYIRDVFMQRFAILKKPMLKALRSTKANCLSLDHTFRISKFIQVQTSKGQNYEKATCALLLALNEKGDVVDFRLTKTESLKEDSVLDMLHDLKQVSPNIKLIMTDNCCHSRQILNDIFEEADIKLDLFHGLNRVIRSIPKKEVSKKIRFPFNKKLSHCTCQEDDHGSERLKETATANEIKQNLDKLISTYEDKLPATSIKELKTLKDKHAQCLASIPRGMGTNRNENLHREMNNFFNDKRTMSLEVTEALLTTFLYHRQYKNTPLAERPVLLPAKSFQKKYEEPSFNIEDELKNFAEDMPIIFQVSERLKKLNLQHVLSRTDLPTNLPPLSSNEASECEKNENTFKELCEMISFRENSRQRNIYDVMASQFSLAIQNIPPVLMEQYQETGFF